MIVFCIFSGRINKLKLKLKERKKFKKVGKEEMFTTKNGLMSVFKQMWPKFASHVCNLRHQYQSIKKIKRDLSENEVLVRMDFSENYNCKYNNEIQSMHFGGSRNQFLFILLSYTITTTDKLRVFLSVLYQTTVDKTM